MRVAGLPDSSSAAQDVDRAVVDYLALIMGFSQSLLRECAADDARRRKVQEIHDAADAAVHLISEKPSAPDAGADQELRAMERDHIVRVLGDLHGNKLAAAKRLGISRRTLYRRLVRHGLLTPGSGL